MKLSQQQEEALTAVLAWLDNPNGRQVFRLFGWAGTGKTTLVQELVKYISGSIRYGAFTGKAALRMQQCGCPDASTIHSLLYKTDNDGQRARKLREQIDKARDEGRFSDLPELREAMMDANKPIFYLNPECVLRQTRLFIVDEVSMVNEALALDVLKQGCLLLVLGDPGQLPPVEGAGYLISTKPDYQLTEIHRQALDSPIIQFSISARERGDVPREDRGDARYLSRYGEPHLLAADVVLTGSNKNRRRINRDMRRILGYPDVFPMPGEKIICTMNNRKYGTLNGLLGTIKERHEDLKRWALAYTIVDEFGKEMTIPVVKDDFEDYIHPGKAKEVPQFMRQAAVSLDFGYCLTVHKAQGSQWDNVLLLDDGFFRSEKPTRKRWLYTGVTRAAQTLQVAGFYG